MDKFIEKLKAYSIPKKITLFVAIWTLLIFPLTNIAAPTIAIGPLILYLIFFPLGYVLFDKNTKNEQKVGWLLLVFFFSWLAFAFYLIKKKD